MSDHNSLLQNGIDPTLTGKVMTQGGAAVAVGSWGASAISWMNENSGAVIALCGVFGAAVGAVGLLVQWYYSYRKLKEYQRHLEGQRNGSA